MPDKKGCMYLWVQPDLNHNSAWNLFARKIGVPGWLVTKVVLSAR